MDSIEIEYAILHVALFGGSWLAGKGSILYG
jgi:hypothetical protein